MELEEIIKIIKNKLSEERFYHSMCVMERCEEISKKMNFDIEIAKKVGIAHDIAKEMTSEDKLKYVKENNIQIDRMEEENPTLLHAKIGADIAKKKLGFTEEMGQAIYAHTTGIPNMNLLDKILFIADRTSKERGFPDIKYVNNLLEEDIDKAVLYILDRKIQLQIERKAPMHINTIITRNWLLQEFIQFKC